MHTQDIHVNTKYVLKICIPPLLCMRAQVDKKKHMLFTHGIFLFDLGFHEICVGMGYEHDGICIYLYTYNVIHTSAVIRGVDGTFYEARAETVAPSSRSEVVECEEFLTLTADQVIQLISCDRLSVANEEKVCVARGGVFHGGSYLTVCRVWATT